MPNDKGCGSAWCFIAPRKNAGMATGDCTCSAHALGAALRLAEERARRLGEALRNALPWVEDAVRIARVMRGPAHDVVDAARAALKEEDGDGD